MTLLAIPDGFSPWLGKSTIGISHPRGAEDDQSQFARLAKLLIRSLEFLQDERS